MTHTASRPTQVLDLGQIGDARLGGGRGRAPYDEAYGVPYEALVRACKAGRAPPLTPADFAAQLEVKSFTSKKADLSTVGRLYADGFEQRFGEARELNYAELGWGDHEANMVAKVLTLTRSLPLTLPLTDPN